MYAQLVEVEGLDPSRREEALQRLRGTVIPALKELDGFAGFIRLHGENDRARSIVLWDTQENAEAGERQMAARREEWAAQLGATIRSSELYEAPIVAIL